MPANSLDNRPPAYSRQKEKSRADRAYVWLSGKKVMLGTYGSPASRARYNELLTGDVSQVRAEPTTDPTVSELILAYLEFATTYYRKPDGSLAREYEHIREVLKYLRRRSGSTFAHKFGPKMLKDLRQELIDQGLSRVYINAQIRRICLFRWAVEEELIPETTHRALAAVRNLKRGRSTAKETAPVRPIDEATVEATLLELPQVLADMVRVQLLTGMRPGKVCVLRPCDIDRSGDVWIYEPEHHKTEYHGHHRVIAIGPKAQSILLRYLARGAEAYCFNPKDSESKRLVEREAGKGYAQELRESSRYKLSRHIQSR